MREIRNVGVVGPGLMGSGIALHFADQGYQVKLKARNQEEVEYAKKNIDLNLADLIQNKMMTQEKGEKIKNEIVIVYTMEEFIENIDFIFECVIEDVKIKQDIFAKLDGITPKDVILATNTSVISITEVAQKCVHKERVIGTHFFNPAFLVPLVEVIKTKDTGDGVMQTTYEFLKKAGKRPIKVNKDVPGFVGNRLQHAILREALYIIEEGIADAPTVDEAVKYSFGMRYPVLGPMEHADLVGTDLSLAIQTYLLKHLCSATEPADILKQRVAKGELGFKTGKGFQTWSKEEITATNQRLNEHLIKMNRKS